MHAADPARSPRLGKLLELLRFIGHATTREIARNTGSCAVHTDIAELRARGYRIDCAYERTTRGRRVYRYTFKGHAA